jgi:hypothetical protein
MNDHKLITENGLAVMFAGRPTASVSVWPERPLTNMLACQHFDESDAIATRPDNRELCDAHERARTAK